MANLFLMTFKGDFHVNLALFRPATQSSTQPGYIANKAVDGNAGDVSTSAITDYFDKQPWWKVQLAYPVWVSQVEVTGDKGKWHLNHVTGQIG